MFYLLTSETTNYKDGSRSKAFSVVNQIPRGKFVSILNRLFKRLVLAKDSTKYWPRQCCCCCIKYCYTLDVVSSRHYERNLLTFQSLTWNLCLTIPGLALPFFIINFNLGAHTVKISLMNNVGVEVSPVVRFTGLGNKLSQRPAYVMGSKPLRDWLVQKFPSL